MIWKWYFGFGRKSDKAKDAQITFIGDDSSNGSHIDNGPVLEMRLTDRAQVL